MPSIGFRKAVCKRGHPRTPENVKPSNNCRLCNPLLARTARLKRPDHYRAKSRTYAATEHGRAARLAWSRTAKGKRRAWDTKIRLRYSLTRDAYDALALASQGRCDLSRQQDENTPATRLDVEHCHKNNTVRGLVCNPCNRMLAAVERYTHGHEWMARALEYLYGRPNAQ